MNRRELVIGGVLYTTAAVLPAGAQKLHPVSLDTARGFLEWPFKVKMGLPTNRCQTGEAYRVICSGGEKFEGEPCPFWTANKDKAVDSWYHEVMKYALPHIRHKSTLYWRDSPFIETVVPDDTDIPFYAVYSRFIISSNPEIYTNIEDYTDAMERQRRYPLHKEG